MKSTSPERGLVRLVAGLLLLGSGAALASPGAEEPFTEDWRWVRFGEEDGLPSSHVIDVVEAAGVPWVLTEEGPASYDGWRWSPVALDPEWGTVRALSVCDDGKLWLRTTLLILRLEEGRFEPSDILDGVPHTALLGFAHLGSGRHVAHVRTPGGSAIVRVGPGGVEAIQEEPAGAVDVELLHDGTRAWLSRSAGLFEVGPTGSIEVLAHRTPGSVSFVSGTPEGELLFGVTAPLGARGVWSGAAGGITRTAPEAGDVPLAGALAPDGTAVVVYDTSEVWVRMDGRWAELEPAPVALADATRLRFRENGDLWATSRSGLHLLRRSSRRWTAWRAPDEGTGRNRVFELALCGENLWAATSGGVERWTEEGPTSVLPWDPGRTAPEVTGLATEHERYVWVGSGHSFMGVMLWNHHDWQHIETTAEGSPIGYVHKIRKDREGRFWLLVLSTTTSGSFAADGRVHVATGRTVRDWPPIDALGPRRFYDFAETPDGSRWFASNEGLERWHDGSWSHFASKNRVFRMISDGADGLWLAKQEGGLHHFHPEEGSQRVRLGTDEQANNVWDLALDERGILWATTRAGLFSVAPDGTTSFFERSAGLASSHLWPIVALDDRIHVGSLGAGILTLDRSEERSPPPRIVIEDREGRLSWQANAWWGEIPSAEVETRNRIDGGPWSPWSRARGLDTGSLAAGAHTFEVQGKGLFGGLTDPGASRLSFRVPRPLFLRTVFLVPVLLLSLALVVSYTVHRRRQRQDAVALERSASEYRALMEEAFDGILIFDPGLVCLAANASADGMVGAGVVGQRLERILPPPEGADWSAVLGDEATFVCERETKGADGRRHVVEAGLKRLPDARVHVVVRDLTHRRRLEEEKQAFERKLTESQRLESLGLLAGGVAHDFNNLLTVIGGSAEQSLQRTGLPPSVAHALKKILLTVERGADLISELLAYAGHEPSPFQVLDMGRVVKETLDLIASSIPPTVRVELDAEDGSFVMGDVGQLRQLVLNLVVNASEAIGGRGRIRVQVHAVEHGPAGEEMIALSVEDDGAGMSAEMLERIYEPFFTTKFKGRGLGLAAVRGIVSGHEGRITVESQPGEGTRFEVLLPIGHEAPIDAHVPAPHVVDLDPTGKVLVIDDDEAVLEVTSSMLDALGFEVVGTTSAKEGLGLYEASPGDFQCVILDVTMPEMSGIEVAEAMREIDPEVRVLMMSGHANEAVATLRRWEEETSFLHKPFSWSELARRVEETLREARRSGLSQRSSVT